MQVGAANCDAFSFAVKIPLKPYIGGFAEVVASVFLMFVSSRARHKTKWCQELALPVAPKSVQR